MAGHQYQTAKRRPLPDLTALDPAVRRILEEIVARHLPWRMVDDAVRMWLYRPPVVDPSLTVVRRNLQLLDLDLAVVPLEGSD